VLLLMTQDITRKFPVVADVGCNSCNIARQLPAGQSGIKTIINLDTSLPTLLRSRNLLLASSSSSSTQHHFAVFDETALPLPADSCDLLLSSLSLHWYNDLPGLLSQCLAALKPDCPMIIAMLGGSTLQELRSAFSLCDRERLDVLLPRVSPFASGRDLGDLLSAAGFALPTIDADTLTVRYPDMFTLCHHLQRMGESGAGLSMKRGGGGRDSFLAAAAAYEELYHDDDGLLPATFQVFYAIGWKPHESQPKPKKRGSATRRFSELEKIIEEKDRETRLKQQPETPAAAAGGETGKADDASSSSRDDKG
jgi:NADH dehydrogenase [ubiquinone] 1 alpha subcomplex assembly factor 5